MTISTVSADFTGYGPHYNTYGMKVQTLLDGDVVVTYGDPTPYSSALKAHESNPALVSYQCSKTGHAAGKIYRTTDGKWWAASPYLTHWTPVEVFSKYEGFLLIKSLFDRENERKQQQR